MSLDAKANRIIDTALAALVGEAQWQALPDSISAAVPDARTTFFLHDADHGRGNFALTSGFSVGETRVYDEVYSRVNPWMPAAARRTVGVGVVADQMLQREQLVRTPFHADFLKPMGCESAVGVTIERMQGRMSLLSLLLPDIDPDLNVPHARLLTNIAVPLRRIMHLQRQTLVEGAIMRATSSALDLSNLGTIILGEDFSVRMASTLARQLAEDGRGFEFGVDGKFRFADAVCAEALAALLHWQPGPKRSYCDVLVHGTLATRIIMVRMATDLQTLYLNGPTVVIILQALTHANNDHKADPDMLFALQRLFNLTKGETDILELLAAGAKAEEIARIRAVSRETVKAQLASLYDKTGMRRQTDLVRLLLR